MKKNKRFENICRLGQENLKIKLEQELFRIYDTVEYGDGYLYAKGDIPIILTAHLDTVHKELPMEIVYKDDGSVSSPQGIGGDDRCGVYMILEIIKKYKCHVLFFEDEETGGEGSNKFISTETCKSLKGNIQYAIELDRRGKTDAVFYNCDNYDFEDFVTKEYWKTAYGSFSDICHICPEIGCAGVNLSCGYYNAHTLDEYVILEEMENNIKEVKKLIERTTDKDWYEYIERKYSYQGKYSYGDVWENWKSWGKVSQEEEYYILFLAETGERYTFVTANSELEAVGYFLMDHPTLTYNDILEIGYADMFDMEG